MLLSPDQISPRQKLILAGLYLSKYDALGLTKLGFHGFTEAFNVLGYALGGRPGSIKNYRDEFDPIVSKHRKGWHKRPTRQYCMDVLEEYKDLDFATFTDLVRSLAGYDDRIWNEAQGARRQTGESQFARRLATGLAAERYFQATHSKIPEFRSGEIEDTTRLGCGYDFLIKPLRGDGPLAVEVKGLTERTGSLFMTPKEYSVARAFGKRFYLFVVKDFARVPFHEIFQDPLSGKLVFKKTERTLIQTSWSTSV